METINKVEIRGAVGFVRLQDVGERKVLHFTVVTNRVTRDKNGMNAVESSWHNCEAWEGENIADLTEITKGTIIHLLGRIKYSKYEGADKIERTSTDIVATKLKIVKDEFDS